MALSVVTTVCARLKPWPVLMPMLPFFFLLILYSVQKQGQKVPDGFYNIELMLNAIARGGEVLMCGACMDARGITDEETIEGAQRSTMKALADKTLEADKVLVF